MSRVQRPTKSIDGYDRVDVKVTFRCSLEQLTAALWGGMRQQDYCPDKDMPTMRVMEAVKDGLRYYGEHHFIEDDDGWDYGGENWCIAQIRRVYGFND